MTGNAEKIKAFLNKKKKTSLLNIVFHDIYHFKKDRVCLF